MIQRILIVDDAYFMRNLIRKALTDEGYEVVGEAKNGTEAIQKYFELKPDLVTMDINLPDTSGIEVTRHIISKDPEAVILAVTRMNDDETREKMFQAGAMEYLTKPFQPAFLMNKINNIMEQLLQKESGKALESENEPDEGKGIVFIEKNGEDDFFGDMEFELDNEPRPIEEVLIENDEESIEIPDVSEQDKEQFQLTEEKMVELEFEDNRNYDYQNREKEPIVITSEQEVPTPPHYHPPEQTIERPQTSAQNVLPMDEVPYKEEHPFPQTDVPQAKPPASKQKEERKLSIEDKWRLRQQELERQMEYQEPSDEVVEPDTAEYPIEPVAPHVEPSYQQAPPQAPPPEEESVYDISKKIRPPRGRYLQQSKKEEPIDVNEVLIIDNERKSNKPTKNSSKQEKPSLFGKLKRWINRE